jgi:hypothetical protein
MKETNNQIDFASMDLGSAKPTSVLAETIKVTINGALFGDFGKAFVREAYRVNPLRAEQVEITEDEVSNYCYYLLDKRIECVNGDCKDYRKLKQLYIPCWIQYNLSMIGRVIDRAYGLVFEPESESKSTMTYEEALAISNKIGAFEDDLQIVQDAMPRSVEGDKDVMSTALVADYVRSIRPVEHVSSTYVTAFMGMKLREEAAFKVLYRVQYDDVNFIAASILNERRVV